MTTVYEPTDLAKHDAKHGPYLLEVYLGRGTDRARWQFQESVKSLSHALAVASRMSTAYAYRLFMEPGRYLYLDWADDGDGLCSPVWRDDPPGND